MVKPNHSTTFTNQWACLTPKGFTLPGRDKNLDCVSNRVSGDVHVNHKEGISPYDGKYESPILERRNKVMYESREKFMMSLPPFPPLFPTW